MPIVVQWPRYLVVRSIIWIIPSTLVTKLNFVLDEGHGVVSVLVTKLNFVLDEGHGVVSVRRLVMS